MAYSRLGVSDRRGDFSEEMRRGVSEELSGVSEEREVVSKERSVFSEERSGVKSSFRDDFDLFDVRL